MKYKVGDRVRIKSIEWYNRRTNGTEIICGEYPFTSDMKEFCGQERIIVGVCQDCYSLLGIEDKYVFTDEMIEGLVEEETCTIPNIYKDGYIHGGNVVGNEITLPQGYQFVDENGNVINATKIVLEKKKEYPKTYEECCKVLGIDSTINHTIGTHFRYRDTIKHFIKLLICRDAYWKLYGEEMGLGKPWSPDYSEEFYEQGCPVKYVIYYTGTHITKERKCTPSYVLSFPTAEMRDAFYENFKELIEQCKELL